MFDPKKLEHFLDSLQVETHFPSTMPQKVIELPRSVLDEKMDRYDIFVQGNFNHNYGTHEFPVYGPRPEESWNSPMYRLMQVPMWSTYGSMVQNSFRVTGIEMPTEEDESATPVETPYDRFKAKLARLVDAESIDIPDPAPPVVPTPPDVVHTITAWRGWDVTDGTLESLGSSAQWEPRHALKAKCTSGRTHAAPDLACHCGYWSFKTRELLEQALEGYASAVEVIGQVEIWGRVIECENGFRSEYAYPKELWLLNDGMESLSWKYGVPVRSVK